MGYLYLYSAHNILSSAVKRPSKGSCSVEKVNCWSLLGPGAESDISDCLVLIMVQVWQRTPSINMSKANRMICDATSYIDEGLVITRSEVSL